MYDPTHHSEPGSLASPRFAPSEVKGPEKMSYHSTVREVYKEAAAAPAANLCCVPQGTRYLPDLQIPEIMYEMNYGCGTTIHLQDMVPDQRVLYVGVGGGLEALQLTYFSRRPGGVIAVDSVPAALVRFHQKSWVLPGR